MTAQAAPSELQKLLSGDAASLLDALMAFLPIGLTIAATPNAKILRVSDVGAALLGRARDQLEGIPREQHSQAFQVYDSRTGELASPDALPLTRATLGGQVVRNEEWLLRTGRGSEITFLCNAGPIRNPVGDVIGGMVAWADLSNQKKLEKDLLEAVAARDQLLAELHHRIGNHLQLVGAMLRLEGRQNGDVTTLVDKIEQRLIALSRAYSALQGAVEDVPAALFLSEICEPLQTHVVRIERRADAGLRLSASIAPTLGIIVNEAVCNALKHAFPNGRKGSIEVSLSHEEEQLILRVVDDGVGFRPRTGESGPGHGQTLMSHLLKSLKGRLQLSGAPQKGTALTAYLPFP